MATNPLSDIDVYILCGGLGKRIRKISKDLPKPMIKIGKYPFLDLIIRHLASFGFKRFILGIGFKADIIKEYYKKNKIKGIGISFCRENTPLDTGGAVKKVKSRIRSNQFFVLNGDSFCDFNPRVFLRFHRKKKALLSILLTRVGNAREYGQVKLNSDLRIIRFEEKNNAKNIGFISAGVYIFDKKIFREMPKDKRFSLEKDFFPSLLKKQFFGCLHSGYFIDIGTPERYFRAKKNLPRYTYGKN